MTQETQLQKAIKIAVKDGWVEQTDRYINTRIKLKTIITSKWLLLKYTTDLNYLMPIAVKVLAELEPQMEVYIVIAKWTLRTAILDLKLDSNNQYTELFEVLFNAIKLLENEQ